MVVEVGGVLGTLAYPHLILSYSVNYGHIATHYGVLDAPLYHVGAIWGTRWYLRHLHETTLFGVSDALWLVS